MIEVHIFNSFLIPELKFNYWFRYLDFINGLVAPSFIFISGFIFVLLSFKKATEYRKFSTQFFKQLRRILLIWITGYLLHVPYYSLKSTLTKTSPEGWMLFFQSDVLQCISVGLMILFFSSIIFKSRKAYQVFNFSFGFIIVFVSPFLYTINFTELIHPFFASYINNINTHSIFPLFPWMGFMLLGGALAPIYNKYREQNKEVSFFNYLILVGTSIIILTAIIRIIPFHIPYTSPSLRSNPLLFFQRVATVLVLMSLCWYYAFYRQTKKSFVIDASKESFLIYVVHLMVIYGAFFNYKSINYYINTSFGIWECIIATLVLICLMILLAKVWNVIKTKQENLARIIFASSWTLIIYNFFVKDYLFK